LLDAGQGVTLVDGCRDRGRFPKRGRPNEIRTERQAQRVRIFPVFVRAISHALPRSRGPQAFESRDLGEHVVDRIQWRLGFVPQSQVGEGAHS